MFLILFYTFLFYLVIAYIFDIYQRFIFKKKMISSGEDSHLRKLSTINRRMFIISAAKVIVFGGIITRLFNLQINQNKKYLTLSDKNRLREWKLPPIRGEFIDYFGNVVAGNSEVYQLHVVPEQVENFKTLMVRLKDILNLSPKNFQDL